MKNKVAPPFRVAEFDMMHSSGISYEGDLLDLGTLHKVISRSGAWFKYNETYLGQGKEKARAFLLENKDVAEEIKDLIMAAGGYAGPEGADAVAAQEKEKAEYPFMDGLLLPLRELKKCRRETIPIDVLVYGYTSSL